EYAAHFEAARGRAAVGEKTPAYLYFPWIAEAIHRNLGEGIKLIAVLRNPVERACSHYWFNVARFIETKSFERALELEEERLAHDTHFARVFSYRDRGFYMRQIRRYLPLFPRENMRFYIAEEIYREPERFLREVCGFLGVDPEFDFQPWLARKNVAPVPKLLGLHQALSHVHVFVRRYTPKWRILHKPVTLFLRALPWHPDRGVMPMKPETREGLREGYLQDVRELEEFLGVDLGRWWPDFARS
ncbi:MAG TPA: hypothetical protein ENI92_07425, partial [Bacteroidetes bacterium]|nr:hypothetical protein [Bacteroidota bacterium]